MNRLARKTEVEVRHVRGHRGNDGNEGSDRMAKVGTFMSNNTRKVDIKGNELDHGERIDGEDSEGENGIPVHEEKDKEYVQEATRQIYRTEVIVPLPEAKARSLTNEAMLKEWERRWTASETCQHTKVFWKKPDMKRSKRMLKLSRYEHGVVSRYWMGFNYTAAFKAKVNPSLSPYCKSCSELGIMEKETGLHVILYCPRWETRRRAILEREGIKPEQMDPLRLARFLSKKEIKELEQGV